MVKLYLDDIRTPDGSFHLVRNYEEFVEWIEKNGLPDLVSFDHDLAEIHYDPSTWTEGFEYSEKTGYSAATWLVEHCMYNKLEMPYCQVHSQNPVGSENIRVLINNYYKTFSIDKVCRQTAPNGY